MSTHVNKLDELSKRVRELPIDQQRTFAVMALPFLKKYFSNGIISDAFQKQIAIDYEEFIEAAEMLKKEKIRQVQHNALLEIVVRSHQLKTLSQDETVIHFAESTIKRAEDTVKALGYTEHVFNSEALRKFREFSEQ